MNQCPNCREEIVKPGRFCAGCGAQLNTNGSASPPADLPQVPDNLPAALVEGIVAGDDLGAVADDAQVFTQADVDAMLAQDRRSRRRRRHPPVPTPGGFWEEMD